MGVIGTVLYIDHIARPLPLLSSEPQLRLEPVIDFVVAENAYLPVTLAPRQIAVSQAISLSEGDLLRVALFTNYWWETSLRLGMEEDSPPATIGVPDRYGPLIHPPDVKITASQPYPDEYRVWLSYRVERVEDAGMYRIVLENKFTDRTMHAQLAYWKD